VLDPLVPDQRPGGDAVSNYEEHVESFIVGAGLKGIFAIRSSSKQAIKKACDRISDLTHSLSAVRDSIDRIRAEKSSQYSECCVEIKRLKEQRVDYLNTANGYLEQHGRDHMTIQALEQQVEYYKNARDVADNCLSAKDAEIAELEEELEEQGDRIGALNVDVENLKRQLTRAIQDANLFRAMRGSPTVAGY
jgi:chromosome segregation ATPase